MQINIVGKRRHKFLLNTFIVFSICIMPYIQNVYAAQEDCTGNCSKSSFMERSLELWEKIKDSVTSMDNPQQRESENKSYILDRGFGMHGLVNVIKYSPDGKFLAVGSSSGIAVFDVDLGEQIKTLVQYGNPVRTLTFSPDGTTLFTGWDNGEVRVFNIADANEVQVGKSILHGKGVRAIRFSPDGKHVITGSIDGTISMWDANTFEKIVTYKGNSGSIKAIAFTKDGRMITNHQQFSLKVAPLPDKSGHEQIIKPVYEDKSIKQDKEIVSFINPSPDGNLVAANLTDQAVDIFDGSSMEKIATIFNDGYLAHSVSFSHKAKQIAIDSKKEVKIYEQDAGGNFRKVDSFENDPKWMVNSVEFSPNDSCFIAVGMQGKIKLWRRQIDKCLIKKID